MDPKAKARLDAARKMSLPVIVQQVLADYAALAAQPDVTAQLRAALAQSEAEVATLSRRLSERPTVVKTVPVKPSQTVRELRHRVEALEARLRLASRPCLVEGCGGILHARGLCSAHYSARRRAAKPTLCQVCGAERHRQTPGLCRACWRAKVAGVCDMFGNVRSLVAKWPASEHGEDCYTQWPGDDKPHGGACNCGSEQNNTDRLFARRVVGLEG